VPPKNDAWLLKIMRKFCRIFNNQVYMIFWGTHGISWKKKIHFKKRLFYSVYSEIDKRYYYKKCSLLKTIKEHHFSCVTLDDTMFQWSVVSLNL